MAIVEHQPVSGEPNRLEQIRAWLSDNTPETWFSDETNIPYDPGIGSLQFGLLWRPGKVTIDPDDDVLFRELRQPRDDSGTLVHQRLRALWLVPVQAGSLTFDLMVLHLKSGGHFFPQADEVEAIVGFIEQNQSTVPGYLIVVGDRNVRPDQSQGRARLHKLSVPTSAGPLMRILTVEQIPPTLDAWAEFGGIDGLSSRSSRLTQGECGPTLSTIRDRSIPGKRRQSAGSFVVIRPRSMISPSRSIAYSVLDRSLRSRNDVQLEDVHITNMGTAPVFLDGWPIRDAISPDCQLRDPAVIFRHGSASLLWGSSPFNNSRGTASG